VETKDLAAQIEDALASGEFELAQFLFSQYTRLLDDRLDEARSSSEGEIVSDALEMMKRWLTLARVARAHISEELRLASCERSYFAQGSAAPILELVG
jgi:hypothetical protein